MNCCIENVTYDQDDDDEPFKPTVKETKFRFEIDPTFITTQGYRKSIAVRMNRFFNSFGEGDVSYQSPVEYVCSSINPWSQKNMLGLIQENFYGMPRLFPWNGEKYIDIWFLNRQGEIVQNPIVRGYLELELIIDNENTYAIDE